uniref:G-protein coupled receptors family 1 profile domain-containing protein n=1 Tax=Cyprinus carpio TaxID=7962 RepID=A0A8C1WNB6_CYPCA
MLHLRNAHAGPLPPPVMFTEFVLGLMGNVLALSVFFFHRDTWKPNSIYLAHLALANSLVLFCLPFRADYYRRGKDWVYGDAFCRILLFLLATNRAGGIFFLTAVAVDRYLKIVHPLNLDTRQNQKSHAVHLSSGCSFHYMFLPKQHLAIAMYVLQSGITRAIEANDTFELTVLDTLQSQRLNRHSHTTAIAQQCI